ncbi:MAG: hypothetical protein AAF499_03850 [Pseudomonadota bacterium]
MAIGDELGNWDGKSTAYLEAIYARTHGAPQLIDELIRSLDELPLQPGASWLLKHSLEQGARLSSAQTDELLNRLASLRDWPATLHLLQCLPWLQMSTDHKGAVEPFVRDNLTSQNKFVRAWALNGFILLSHQFDELAAEADSRVAHALENEAPSVKARLRAIFKEHDKRAR